VSHAVVMCVEQGSLEYKGLCLLLTLRRHAGSLRDLPVYVYSPRPGREASPWAIELFERLGARHVSLPLNERYFDYPLANKPLSMAHAERTLDHDYLIFLDSDILCWHEPRLFTLQQGKDLAMTVDTTKSTASSGAEDPFDPIWMDLYRLAGSEHYPFVTTTLTDERVRGWWGSGVIIARRSAGLMARWEKIFEEALATVDFSPSMLYMREQMTISALAAALGSRLEELPITYNYPVQNYSHFSARGTPAHDACLWHYQPYLNKAFRKFGERLDRVAGAEAKLAMATEFCEKLKTGYSKMIGLDESWVRQMRSRLRIRTRIKESLARFGIRIDAS
jgi:hypothetical protein